MSWFLQFPQRTNTEFGLHWTNCPRVLRSVTWIESLSHSAPQVPLTTGRQEWWAHALTTGTTEESFPRVRRGLLDSLHPPFGATWTLHAFPGCSCPQVPAHSVPFTIMLSPLFSTQQTSTHPTRPNFYQRVIALCCDVAICVSAAPTGL